MPVKSLVCIPGLNGSRHNFKFLRHYLGPSQSFDLPGFGDEAAFPGPYTLEAYLDFLNAKITEKSVLIGHSFGSILAKEFALKFPQRVERLVLLSYPVQKSSAALRAVLEQKLSTKMFLRSSIIGSIMCHSKAMWKFFVLPFAWIFKRKYYDSAAAFFRHSYRAEIETIENVVLKDFPQRFENLTVPYLIVVGGKDRFIDFEYARNFNVRILPNMGHMFFEFEKEIADIIISFSDLPLSSPT